MSFRMRLTLLAGCMTLAAAVVELAAPEAEAARLVCGKAGSSCCRGSVCGRGLSCRQGRCYKKIGRRPLNICGIIGTPCCKGARCRGWTRCVRGRCRGCGRKGLICCPRQRCARPDVCNGGRCCRKPGPQVRARFIKRVADIRQILARPVCGRGGKLNGWSCDALLNTGRSLTNALVRSFNKAMARACKPDGRRTLTQFRKVSRLLYRVVKRFERCKSPAKCCVTSGTTARCSQALVSPGSGVIGFLDGEATMSNNSISFDLWSGTGLPGF